MTTFILSGLIFFAAGTVQGLTGFGAALVALPLLIFIMDIKVAIPLCILNGLIITTFLAYTLRRHLDRKKILPLLLGAMPGIVLGGLLLRHINPAYIQYLLGALLICYSVYNLVARPRPLRPAVGWGYVAGFFSGAITAALSAGGPPTIIYTTLTDWSKDEIKATLTGFFALNAYLTAAMHALSGMTTTTTLGYFAASMPFVLAGTASGAQLADKINRKTYLKLVYFFLIFMGIMMLISAMP